MQLTKSALVAAVALGMLAMTGCSNDDEDGTQPDPVPSPTDTSEPSSVSGVVSPPGLPKLPQFKGESEGVVSDVGLDECETTPGKVSASGTVRNSSDETSDTAVVVTWTSPTSDVVGRVVERFPNLAPGRTETWSVNTRIDFEGTTQCVLSAYRGTFKGRSSD